MGSHIHMFPTMSRSVLGSVQFLLSHTTATSHNRGQEVSSKSEIRHSLGTTQTEEQFSMKTTVNFLYKAMRNNLSYKPAFMYLPACLISQTGGLSTSFPRAALSNKGSVAFTVLGSATAPKTQYTNPEKVSLSII